VTEKQHEKRCNDLMAHTKAGCVFQCSGKVIWRCRNCGYLYEDDTGTEKCHACDYAQAHFELLTENWKTIISGALGAAL